MGNDHTNLDFWKRKIDASEADRKEHARKIESIGTTELFPTRIEPVSGEEKVGRNDPCLCGSGKKYKKCCG